MNTADWYMHSLYTWDQFRIADSGAKHAATQGERYRFKGDTTDWFVKVSTSPVGVGVDSSLRMLAWGCRHSNPGGVWPLSPPPLCSERGGAH